MWIAKTCEITRPRNNVQIIKDSVIAILLFHLRDAALLVLDITEHDRVGGTGLSASRGKRIARNALVWRSACTRERDDLCFFDALHAVSAFLHHAAHAHSHVGIFLHLHRLRRALRGQRRKIFLTDVQCADELSLAAWSLVVIEIIKAPYFVRTVVRTKSRADAAVVSHHVEPVLAVNRRVHWTNGFSRRVLTMLARHRLEHHLGMLRPVSVVLIEWLATGVITSK